MYDYNEPGIKILLCDYREKVNSWKHENVFNSWWYSVSSKQRRALLLVRLPVRGTGRYCGILLRWCQEKYANSIK